MPLQTAGIIDDEYTQADLEPAPGSAASAAIGAAVDNFLSTAILQGSELSTARRYGNISHRVLSPDEATAWVAERGLAEVLKVDDRSYNELELSILVQRKRAELQRASVIRRIPQTPGRIAGTMALQIGAQLFDPPGVALAFVPVVGEARYAKMLAGATGAFERAAVRARVGAVEGAVGSAIAEPLIYASKRQEQADYQLSDSLLNIAFGTVFGGGLHTVGGAVVDRLRAPAERRAADLELLKMRLDAVAADRAGAAGARPTADLVDVQTGISLRAAREEIDAARADTVRLATEMLDAEEARLRPLLDAPAAREVSPKWGELESRLTVARQESDRLATTVSKLYEPEAVRAEVDRLAADSRYVAGLRRRFNQQNVADRIEQQAVSNVTARRSAFESQLEERRAVFADLQRQVEAARSSFSAEQRLEQIRVARAAGDLDSLVDALPSDAGARIRERLERAETTALRVLNTDEARAYEARRAATAAEAAELAGPAAREAALRTAIAQAVRGEAIDVAAILRRDMEAMKAAAQRPTGAVLFDPDALARVEAQVREGESLDAARLQAQIDALTDELRALDEEAGLGGYDGTRSLGSETLDELAEVTVEADADAAVVGKAARLLAACAVKAA